MREHEADGAAVWGAEMRGEGIGGGMGGAEHTIFNGGSGQGSAKEDRPTGFEVGGGLQDTRQAGDGEPECFARKEKGQRSAWFGDGGFECVSYGIDAAARRDGRGLRNSQCGIQNGN